MDAESWLSARNANDQREIYIHAAVGLLTWALDTTSWKLTRARRFLSLVYECMTV